MTQPSPDQQILRGLLDSLVLDVLSEGPNYGFGILQQLEDRLGEAAGMIKEATLYPLLHRLEENEYLRSHLEPGARGRPRKYYRMTPEGHALLELRIDEWHQVSKLLERTLLRPRCKKGEQE
ncbi:MAG: PadR family transcriptional regulator [Wenzhouxiangella sp.]|jgi:PadR family transcriptional regulator PadR|nr:PadR family transcriptional regulator [Wenzhouxiangella sp.]